MTSKPSRVSGVYGLLTLIEVQCRVLLTTRVSLHVKVFPGCLFGWMARVAGYPQLLWHPSRPKQMELWVLGTGGSACLELKQALGGKSKELAMEAEGKPKHGSPVCRFELCVL